MTTLTTGCDVHPREVWAGILLCVVCGLPGSIRAGEEDAGHLGSEALRRGVRLLEVDRLGQAERDLTVAARLLPEQVEAQYALGYLRFRQARFQESAALLEKALELDPDYTNAIAKLGLCRVKLADFASAERAFARLVEPSALLHE